MEEEISVADSGDLARECFPVLLARHHKKESMGTLVLDLGRYQKRVYLRGGRVVFAASDDSNDRLGEMLVRRGVLKVPVYVEVSAIIKPGVRFGTVLVERGVLTPDQLVWSVKEQVKEIVFSLFDVSQGSYEFREGQEAEEKVITLTLNTPELIRQGVARMEKVVWALEACRDPAARLELAQPREAVEAAFELGEFEHELFDQIAAPKPMAEIFNETPFPHFDLLKFIWVLSILEMVRILPPEANEGPVESVPDIEVTSEDLEFLA